MRCPGGLDSCPCQQKNKMCPFLVVPSLFKKGVSQHGKGLVSKFFRGLNSQFPIFHSVIRTGNKNHWPSEQRYQYTSHSTSSTYEPGKQYSKAVAF